MRDDGGGLTVVGVGYERGEGRKMQEEEGVGDVRCRWWGKKGWGSGGCGVER